MSLLHLLKLSDLSGMVHGIALEEQRLENAIAEVFTNAVIETDNKKYYPHKTILNGVEFVMNKNLF